MTETETPINLDETNKVCTSCGWWVPDFSGPGWCDRLGEMTSPDDTCEFWQTGRLDTEDDGYPD